MLLPWQIAVDDDVSGDAAVAAAETDVVDAAAAAVAYVVRLNYWNAYYFDADDDSAFDD